MANTIPTVEIMKEYKEKLVAAADARDKTSLLGILRELDRYPVMSPTVLGRSLLGLAVGKLRNHQEEEVRQRAVQLVDRWRASAPAKRSNSSARTTQISQQEGLRRYGSSMSRRMSARDSSKKQASVDQTSASARSEAPKQVMGPPANPVSRGRKPARDAGKSKSSASASISARSGRSVSNSTSADEPPEPHIKPERSFESDRPGEAASLHEVPLRALTIELFYDALVAGTDDLPSESILPTAIGIEDGIYLETGASEDEYVSCAHAAFLALSTASSVSTMRNDLLAGSIGADGFVDYILKEEGQTT